MIYQSNFIISRLHRFLARNDRFGLVCYFDLVNFLTPYNNSRGFTYASCEYCITEMKFSRYYFEDDTQQEIQKRINSEVVQTSRAEVLT